MDSDLVFLKSFHKHPPWAPPNTPGQPWRTARLQCGHPDSTLTGLRPLGADAEVCVRGPPAHSQVWWLNWWTQRTQHRVLIAFINYHKQIQQREKVQEQSLEEMRQSLPGVPSQWSHRMHLIPSAMSCELWQHVWNSPEPRNPVFIRGQSPSA